MLLIERVPDDINEAMTGIKVKHLPVAEYLHVWTPTVSKLSIDASQVELRVNYFDEYAYYN